MMKTHSNFTFQFDSRRYNKATIALNGVAFQADITHTIALNAGTWPEPGVTKLTWVVTAQDAVTTRTYSLTVGRRRLSR